MPLTRRSRRARWGVVLLGGALIAAGCGSRRSDQEHLAAARGAEATATAPAAGGSSAAGVGTSAGSSGAALDRTTSSASGGATATEGAGAAPSATDAEGGAAGSGDAGGPAAVACTGDEQSLTIGTIGQLSGVFGPYLQPIAHGLQAWVSSVNARGGVNCHPIELIVKDDGGDPSVHQAQVQELVEQRNAIALVATTAALTGNASVSYLTSHGVPVIGNEGGSEWFYESPVYFPQMTTGNTALAALVGAIARVGVPQGKTDLAVLTCLEAALCSSLYGEAEPLAQQAGLSLVYRAQASLAQPDFTSACQNAKDRGANLFIIGLDTNSIRRVLRNCDSIGYHPIYITGGPLVTPEVLADPRAEGFLVSSATDLYIDEGNAAVAEYLDAIATYAPGLEPSIASLAGWTAGRLFEVGLRGAAEPTREALLASLGAIQGNDLGGLTYPLTFTTSQPSPRVSCVWIGQVRGGTLVPAEGAPPGRFCE